MKTNKQVSRREFIRVAGALGIVSPILMPSHAWGKKTPPSDRLTMGFIGVGKQNRYLLGKFLTRDTQVVAVCDVDTTRRESAKKIVEEWYAKKTLAGYKGCTAYEDFRELLARQDIDAVCIASPDHWHAIHVVMAAKAKKDIYCEKPLGNSVEEVRVVRANYLKNKDKLATQVGTQRHEYENFNRVRELILDGAIGELTEVSAWGSRKIPRPGYLPAQGEPPPYFHFDLWLGPSPEHPYNPGYFSGGPGANCLSWNMYWDFGSGQIGDMGSHTMDLAWNALDADLPTSAQAKGDPFNPEVTPVRLQEDFDIPANDWRGAIRVSWFQGGAMPDSPVGYLNLKGAEIDHGALFEGTRGALVAGFETRALIPGRNQADLTYYKSRPKEKLLPPLGNFQMQWIKACKGNLKTSCNFDYGGKMIEMMLLGLVAYRVGKKVSYDGATGVTDNPEANALLHREYRPGWTLNG